MKVGILSLLIILFGVGCITEGYIILSYRKAFEKDKVHDTSVMNQSMKLAKEYDDLKQIAIDSSVELAHCQKFVFDRGDWFLYGFANKSDAFTQGEG
jgi:hypothetical protein